MDIPEEEMRRVHFAGPSPHPGTYQPQQRPLAPHGLPALRDTLGGKRAPRTRKASVFWVLLLGALLGD